MEETTELQICFIAKDGKKLLCNCVDLNGDGKFWKPKSGKWIPIPIENAPAATDANSEENVLS